MKRKNNLKVLFVKMRSLGDIVLLTPTIRILKKKFQK